VDEAVRRSTVETSTLQTIDRGGRMGRPFHAAPEFASSATETRRGAEPFGV